MIEKISGFTVANEKTIEKLVNEDPVQINHIILPKDDRLPEHDSNSNVYLIILRGTMTIRLDEQEPHRYDHGQIVNVPCGVKMNIGNFTDVNLEFFVVKSPNPKHYDFFTNGVQTSQL
jgi:quercetin dioxygenase-like cupin family protein